MHDKFKGCTVDVQAAMGFWNNPWPDSVEFVNT